ncbi:probable transposase [Caldimicrobium thiodismutans]|uniref:Probable transposase n=2 Tax=Caldimicrobium thiodismutans TaxID=1653476 RepID=A0A0U4W2T4_9BACT|nr:probable transposase [Caldimicrobium thiodismutans]
MERHMPEPGSNRGYKAWQYIEPILLMLIGGGRHIEELREIIEDEGLRKLTGMKKIPSPSTVGDWIRRQGNAIGNVMESIMKPYSLLPDGKRIKHA